MIIETTAQQIKAMEIRGAGKIARAVAFALKEYSTQLYEHDTKKYIQALENATIVLKNTRPTAVSLTNAINYVMRNAKGDTVEQIRDNIIKAADEFISNSENAVNKIAGLCANKIKDGDVILTHCNSTTAVQSIIKAFQDGKKVRVFSTETRPWRQGHITSQALADAGVDVTLIVDSAARHFMKEINIIIIGADTITASGTVYNKIGTSQIALCAHEFNIPVIVCAESYKFSDANIKDEEIKIEERDHNEVVEAGILKGVKIRNPVFDSTPAEYICEIITEQGIVLPQEIPSFLDKIY